MPDPAGPPPVLGAVNNYNKLIAGSTASLVGGAVTTVVLAVIAAAWPAYIMSLPLQGAIQTLVTVATTAAAIFLTPHERTTTP